MTVTTENPSINGVDVATLFATLDAVKGQHEIANFQFRATNTWVNGTHSRSTYNGFFGAMQEMEHAHETEVVSDHPAVLVGQDNGPTPVEYLLHGIPPRARPAPRAPPPASPPASPTSPRPAESS